MVTYYFDKLLVKGLKSFPFELDTNVY
jgi:hypothetical protein